MKAFTHKVNRWYREFITEASDQIKKRHPQFEFQPITDCYLKSDFAVQRVKGNLNNIYIFTIIAGLLLAIACINFINLGTSRTIRHLRETGIHKVLGASRTHIVIQFLSEAMVLFGIATVLALALYSLSLGALEQFIDHPLTITFTHHLPLFLSLALFIILVCLLTGLYPAWVLSGFNITHSLKNRLGNLNLNNGLIVKKFLVVLQFCIGLLVLIGLFTIRQQLVYMKQKPLGYHPKHVFTIPAFYTANGHAETIKHEIEKIPGIESVSVSTWIPTEGYGRLSKTISTPNQTNKPLQVNFITGDNDLPNTLGIKLISGRFFDGREEGTGFHFGNSLKDEELQGKKPSVPTALLTASTAKLLGNPPFGYPIKDLDIIPIGIVEDFHSRSLHDPIKPTVIVVEEGLNYVSFLVKVRPGFESSVTKSVNTLFHQFQPNKPLEIRWLEDLIKTQYDKEAKQVQLFTFFSVLISFLSALGIFGLVVHATEQRVKEIGIRKVLGASVSNIVHLFSLDYVKLVGIALLVTSPIAWWAMNRWLEDFAYHIDMGWWIFALAGLIVSATALFTIGIQTIKAAVANPVESLRNE